MVNIVGVRSANHAVFFLWDYDGKQPDKRDSLQDPSGQGVDEMTKTTLLRRHLLAGASATAAASFVASACPAAAKAPHLESQAPAFDRFNVEVGDVALECTSCGSGIPVMLLANAGCSVGYFDDLAGMLATRGLQAVSINMRGVAGSRG